MAKFCDVEKFKSAYEHRVGIQFDNAIHEMEKEEFCADVIERSEYIESQKEVMRLRDLSHKVNQNAMQYEGMYRDLHRKIDNAILVLEREQNSEFWGSTFRDGIGHALEILKRNIGESEL